MKIKLIAIMGMSASGKDYLVKSTLAHFPNLNPVVHYTTRPKRLGEIEGKDYFFVSKELIEEKDKAGEIFSITCFNNWYYAIGKDSFVIDKINIGVFNPKELKLLIKKYSDIFDFYIIKTKAPKEIRFKRSLERLKPFDKVGLTEIARREEADIIDFSIDSIKEIPHYTLYTYDNFSLNYSKYKDTFNEKADGPQTYAEIYNEGYMAGLLSFLGYSD